MNYTVLISLIAIVVIICYIERWVNRKHIKHTFNVPKKYSVHKIEINDGTHDVIIYNNKWYKNNKHDLPNLFGELGYKLVPTILVSDRINVPIKKVITNFKNVSGDSIVSDIINTTVPLISEFISFPNVDKGSKYRVLTSLSGIKATSDENYIYIRI